MTLVELRDLDAARRFVVEGLWLQRVVLPTGVGVRPALEWALAVAAYGQPLPPVGFVADLGHLLLGTDRESRDRPSQATTSVWPAGLARTYEDLVLGKLMADRTFERAADAVRRYQGRDRGRGVAYVVNQVCERAGFGGVLLSPAILKGLLERSPDEVLARAWETANRGVDPLLIELYQRLIADIRQMADLLGPEDVFELEHGTALANLGQRVALRQTVQMAAALEAALPKTSRRPRATPREVPTQAPDEDTYPVGGFASISTRGTVESLLHSQLAFMEPATAQRPDLFDVKFVRDELLYYSRDENQFLRRRRSFVITLMPDLVAARFKDVNLPSQRMVLILAALVVTVRKLTEWLSADALTFEFLFVADGERQPLAQEEALLAMLLREAIANGAVRLARVVNSDAALRLLTERARQCLCKALVVGATDVALPGEVADLARLVVAGPRPVLAGLEGEAALDGDGPWAVWQSVLGRLLERWI
jgi:hypothetical protein